MTGWNCGEPNLWMRRKEAPRRESSDESRTFVSMTTRTTANLGASCSGARRETVFGFIRLGTSRFSLDAEARAMVLIMKAVARSCLLDAGMAVANRRHGFTQNSFRSFKKSRCRASCTSPMKKTAFTGLHRKPHQMSCLCRHRSRASRTAPANRRGFPHSSAPHLRGYRPIV